MDLRYIYIGRTTRNRSLVKIGIAANPRKRWQQIDNSIKGSKEYPVAFFRVLNARQLERQLHSKYANKRKGYKGSGKTEWFALGFFARIWLWLIIAAHGLILIVLAVVLMLSVLVSVITLSF